MMDGKEGEGGGVRIMVSNTTFNNISVISVAVG
jgi:hypothetical protein